MANVNKSNDESLFNLMLRRFPNGLDDELIVEPPQGKINVYTGLEFARERKARYTKFHESQMLMLSQLEVEERKMHRLEFSKFIKSKYGDLIKDGKFLMQSMELYSPVVNVLQKDEGKLVSTNAGGSNSSSIEEGEIGDEHAELVRDRPSVVYDNLYQKFQEEHEKRKKMYQAKRQNLIRVQENIMTNIQKLIKDPSGGANANDKQNSSSKFDLAKSSQQEGPPIIKKEIVSNTPVPSATDNVNYDPTYSTTPTSSPPKNYQSLPVNFWRSQSHSSSERNNERNNTSSNNNNNKSQSSLDTLGSERYSDNRMDIDYGGDLSRSYVYESDMHGESRIGKHYYPRDTDRYSDGRKEKIYDNERSHNYPYDDERYIDRNFEGYVPPRSHRDNLEITESRRLPPPHDSRHLSGNVGYRRHHYPRVFSSFRPFRHISRKTIRGRPFKLRASRGIRQNDQRGRYNGNIYQNVPET